MPAQVRLVVLFHHREDDDDHDQRDGEERQLIRLSREHHQALGQALWLRRSIVGDVVGVRARFLEFWHEEAEPHFALEELEALHALGDRLQRHVRFEERILFPVLEASLDPVELATVAEQLTQG